MDIIKNSQTRKDMTLANIESQYADELTKIEEALQIRENSGFPYCTVGIADTNVRDKIRYYLNSKGYNTSVEYSNTLRVSW